MGYVCQQGASEGGVSGEGVSARWGLCASRVAVREGLVGKGCQRGGSFSCRFPGSHVTAVYVFIDSATESYSAL